MNNDQDKNKQQSAEDQQHHNSTLPTDQSTGDSPTDSDGSMSSGNLSNSRYSRERTRSFHDKTTVTGSDTDGQAN